MYKIFIFLFNWLAQYYFMHILATASIKMSGLPDRNSADHISNYFCQEDSKGLCWKMQIPPPQSLRIPIEEDQNECLGQRGWRTPGGKVLCINLAMVIWTHRDWSKQRHSQHRFDQVICVYIIAFCLVFL